MLSEKLSVSAIKTLIEQLSYEDKENLCEQLVDKAWIFRGNAWVGHLMIRASTYDDAIRKVSSHKYFRSDFGGPEFDQSDYDVGYYDIDNDAHACHLCEFVHIFIGNEDFIKHRHNPTDEEWDIICKKEIARGATLEQLKFRPPF